MYYISKLTQAAGLTIVLIDYLKRFPELMDRRILAAGVALFALGWTVQRFFLKRTSQ